MGALAKQNDFHLRDLEGQSVSLALADGSRLDEVVVVSAGRGRVSSLWLDVGGMDLFIHQSQVVGAWKTENANVA